MIGLLQVYNRLYSSLGPQHWWPAETPFEVMIGAILTQNTNWANVEKAIRNLKRNKLLYPQGIHRASNNRLALLIKPAGYFNVKTRRLKSFLKYFIGTYQADIKKMSAVNWVKLREELLSVNGIGPETADSILLYAFNKPVFVVDAYTRRIFLRHGYIKQGSSYDNVQNFFMSRLEPNAKLFNEYHALIVKTAKEFCLKNNPRCGLCPLSKLRKDI